MEDKLLNTNEVTKYLGVCKPTLTKYIREGRIKAVKVGRGWKILESELNLFAGNDHKNEPLKNICCPNCGELMEMETILTTEGESHVWYCINEKHKFSLSSISMKKAIDIWNAWFL